MTLRIAAEKAAYALVNKTPRIEDENRIVRVSRVADAIEAMVREFAASALVHARCSCGLSEGYENGLSALSEDGQAEALLCAERDL